MTIGDRGTSTGSWIGGQRELASYRIHERRGVVAITNEHRSSQTCVSCYQKVVRPKRTVVKDGKQYIKNNDGTSLCVNPRCIAVKKGKDVQGSDRMASVAICLAGVHGIKTGQALPPFSPKNSTKTGTQLLHQDTIFEDETFGNLARGGLNLVCLLRN
ncbi:uncharacterized protein BX664DRAFT_383664 [Halteromyces radiatus]|uniref:uncharacterized protein n=1 Tax=Halteromyces radiatus TaxID=101107 RepID=UPI00221EE2D6|nr:uncharacterized protein BX664DRAFT_383664 [Halteromyces radiatus]KAI8097363.1 hypothetical protein BX664DRAFT_383664 [Halteromyces radiatus]